MKQNKFRTIGQAAKEDPTLLKLKKGPNGNNLCRYCSVEVEPPRRTFCSGKATQYRRRKINGVWGKIVYERGFGCVHEWMLRSSPKYARGAVFDRDQGVCAQCGNQNSRRGSWAADHINEVADGYGLCGLENYQTLCDPCHKAKTKESQGRRAAERRRLKALQKQAEKEANTALARSAQPKDNGDTAESNCNSSPASKEILE